MTIGRPTETDPFVGEVTPAAIISKLLQDHPEAASLPANVSNKRRLKSLTSLRRRMAAIDSLRSDLEDMAQDRHHRLAIRDSAHHPEYLTAFAISQALRIDQFLISYFRKRLLRLVDSIRASLRLM